MNADTRANIKLSQICKILGQIVLFLVMGLGWGQAEAVALFKADLVYRTGNHPIGVAVEQGNSLTPLIAVANYGDSSLTLFKRRSDGELELVRTAALPGPPRAVAMGDFNQDGKPDLAIALEGKKSLQVWINSGNNTFKKTVYATAYLPIKLVTGDGAGSGFQDHLLVIYQDRTELEVFANFRKIGVLTVSAPPFAARLADVDQDGHLDVVTTSLTNSTVSVLLQKQPGKFVEQVPLSVDAMPVDLALGDWNGDGRLDLAVASLGRFAAGASGSVTVFLTQANGSQGWHQTIQTQLTRAAALVTGDWNADGRVDLAVADVAADTSGIQLFQGRGDGTFSPYDRIYTGLSPVALQALPRSSGQGVDLLTVNWDSATLSLFVRRANGTYGIRSESYSGLGPHWVRSADFNQDGRSDLMIANIGEASVSVLLGKDHRQFQPEVKYPTPAPVHAVSSGDLNQDGWLDMVSANIGGDSITLFFGQGDGTFQPGVDISLGPGPHVVSMADLNGDGRMDLVVPLLFSDVTVVLLNQGGGRFEQKSLVKSGEDPSDVALQDLDGDGVIDMVISHFMENDLFVFKGSGDGTFVPMGTIPIVPAGNKGGQHSVYSAEVTGDGILDLVGSLFFMDSFFIIPGQAGGGFEPARYVRVGPIPSSLIFSDFTQDGLPDIAVVVEHENAVTIFQGHGQGQYTRHSSYAVEGRPVDMTLADFDQNGQMDLAVVNWYTNSVNVLWR